VAERQISLVGGSRYDHRSVEPALALIASGRHPLQLLTTHHFAVEDADLALRTAAGRTEGHAVHVTVGG
jgi:threonine dehydrogenase-like Zn-dependent dehydrogenase